MLSHFVTFRNSTIVQEGKVVVPAEVAGAPDARYLLQGSVHVARDVDAKDMREAFDEGFEKSAGDKLAALKDRIGTLKTSLTRFKEGDHLAFSHDPAQGVAVDVDGTAGKTIHGDDFADALPSIWIGNEPPDEEIKVGLPGGKCA